MNELSQFLVDSVLLDDVPAKNIVGIYPGRFHPPGKHHATVFKGVQRRFGKSNAFVATSNKIQLPGSPLNFSDKLSVWKKHGVSNVLQIRSPYNGEDYFKGTLPSKFKPEETAIVFVVGAKDGDRLSPKYYTKLTNPSNLTPYLSKDETGKEVKKLYWMESDNVSMNVPGYGQMSGTTIRQALGQNIDRKEKEKLFKHIIGFYDRAIYDKIVPKFESIFEVGVTDNDIEDFITSERFGQLLNELTNTVSAGGRASADDGPNYHYPNHGVYQRVSLERAQQVGYSVIDYVLNGSMEHQLSNAPIYPDGPVDAVSFLPAGIAGTKTPMNQEDLIGIAGWNKWFDHVTRVAGLAGYEVLKTKEERIRQAKERAQSSIQSTADVAQEKERQETLMESKRFIENYHKLIDASDNIDPEVKELIKLKKGDTREEIKKKIDRAYSSHSLFREAMKKILDNKSDIPSDAITYNDQFDEDQRSTIRHCVEFTLNELGIDKCPPIMLTADRDDIVTTAYYNIESHQIKVYTKGRALADVLRSVVHEIVHHQQNLEERIRGIESIDLENEAHSKAGEIITKFKDESKTNIYVNEYNTTTQRNLNLLLENPDVINCYDLDGKFYQFSWRNSGIPFGYIGKNMRVGRLNTTHGDIEDGNTGWGYDRSEFDFPGRIWPYEKVMTFWEYPDRSKFKKVVNDINKELRKDGHTIKVGSGWKVEVLIKGGDVNSRYMPKGYNWGWEDEWDMEYDGGNKVTGTTQWYAGMPAGKTKIKGGFVATLIPIEKYAGSEKQVGKGKLHVLPPMKKSELQKLSKKWKDALGMPTYKMPNKGKKAYQRAAMRKGIYTESSAKKKVLTELADKIQLPSSMGGGELHFEDPDAHPFGYYREFDVGAAANTHYDVFRLSGNDSGLKYAGRLWKGKKVISFWQYPENQSKLKSIIKDIEKSSNIKIWGNGWVIEEPFHQGDREWEYNDYSKTSSFIPIESFKKPKQLKIKYRDHMASPVGKGKKFIPLGVGSKKNTGRKAYQRAGMRKGIYAEGLITEGGAYGHLAHPFDDHQLTFGILKQMVTDLLSGNIQMATEKTDGQNLMMSWKDGRAIFARNKGHIKNFGVNALDVSGIKTMFAGREELENAFTFAANDLQQAVSKLTDKQRNLIFSEGEKWMSFEVIYPATSNVIPYGHSLLSFHGSITYDEAGNPIGGSNGSGRILAGMIKQVNADVQSAFNITGPQPVTLPKSKNFNKSAARYISKITRLQRKFNLKDSDTVALYHQRWWEKFIDNSHAFPEHERMGLVKRWAFFDKSFRINAIDDLEKRKWATKIDKQDHKKMIQQNMLHFELIFLQLGAEILQNMTEFLAVNPNKKAHQIRQETIKAIHALRKSADLKTIEFLHRQLGKLNAIGGVDAIVPSEGIVFSYNDKLYKLTGAFAPVNQILGYFKFGR